MKFSSHFYLLQCLRNEHVFQNSHFRTVHSQGFTQNQIWIPSGIAEVKDLLFSGKGKHIDHMLLPCWRAECLPFLLSRNTANSMIRAQLMVKNRRTWQLQPLMDFAVLLRPLPTRVNGSGKRSNFPIGAPNTQDTITQAWSCLKAHMLQHLS